MSLLAEFYTTNKTAEASRFLLTVCKEINRPDVVALIEKAQRESNGVVEDAPAKFERPPQVFLSYDWSNQDNVKVLKQCLEKEGFDCWMDIGTLLCTYPTTYRSVKP